MAELNADKQQAFAEYVVQQLRAAGYEAYWAGGCVRDRLLGRTPKDYDVATGAVPAEVQAVFEGKRKTLALGASFGVIAVVGPRGAGQIEVATFREDVSYSDGRRPDAVRFTTAREDALRRDFSINGMFYDPDGGQVLDFVGGQEDLRRGIVRAIGEPRHRFAEDKLRMLRAVRIAAYFGFTIEPATLESIRSMAGEITVVSAERIANEMRMMLERRGRRRAVELLLETGLLEVLLPEVAVETRDRERWERTLKMLEALEEPSFPLALAVLLSIAEDGTPTRGGSVARNVSERWRLSNDEAELGRWLLKHRKALAGAAGQKWSRLQPVLAHKAARDLLTMTEVAAAVGMAETADVEFCRQKLSMDKAKLNPRPLITGEDLIQIGLPQGKAYARLLRLARDAQLDGQIQTREEAIALVQSAYKIEQP
jgi:tRNA nucleotidyltransferase/poly(A) polymerase